MNSNYGLPAFYSNTRQGEAARDVARHESENSALENPSAGGCGNGWAVGSAANAAGLIPKGNFGNSPEGGCAIDKHSELLWGDPASIRFKGPKQLFQRPWATTPFMGNGDPDVVPEESKLIFGHSTANRKSIQTVSDKQFPVFEPLIVEKESDIPDHNYFVEPFLRGGFASRLVPKTRIRLN
jgi:hypothetical protein